MILEPIHLIRNRPILLHNNICPYCGVPLTSGSTTKEHVVGRRFVPKGTLHGDWNLILQACAPCNSKKGALEDDISAITMHPDAFGRCGSEVARSESCRKGLGSTSTRTGKLVAKSAEAVNIDGSFGCCTSVKVNLTAPPQVDDYRAFELARMQLMGFFYLITYAPSASRGYFWRGGFFPLVEACRSDWGNDLHRAFMGQVLRWDIRLLLSTASDHFAVAIRKHPTEQCWSWALEWNRSLRLIGFFGDGVAVQAVAGTFPGLDVQTVFQSKGSSLYFRRDIALAEEDDILFSVSA